MRLTERLRKNLKDLFIPKQHLYLDEVEDPEKELEKYWCPENQQLHYVRKKKINMMYLSLFRYTTRKSIWMNV